MSRLTHYKDLVIGIIPMIKAGIIRPIYPHILIKIARTVYRWGFTPAGLISMGAHRNAHQLAIIDDYGELSYHDLNRSAHALAIALAKRDVKEGDTIGILARNHRGFLQLLGAAGRLGLQIVLLNTGASAQQLSVVIVEQKLRWIVIDQEFAPLLGNNYTTTDVIVTWPQEGSPLPSHWENLQDLIRSALKENDDILPKRPRSSRTIVLTSGTTGTPKGARRPEPKDWMPAAALTSIFPLRSQKCTVISSPLFHTWALAALQINLALRSTIVLARKPTPVQIVELAQKYHAHSLFLVPTILQRIVEDPTARQLLPLKDLQIVAASGSAITTHTVREVLQIFGPVLYNLYGTTEVAWTTIATPQELTQYPSTAGRPPLGTRVKVFDDHNRNVPTGTIGRIFVGNSFVFEGYTSSEQGKEIVDGLVCTGDLGHFTKEGLLFVEGRSDDMIVSGGENVYPNEVENILADLPGVRESAVVGVIDEKFGMRLAAYIVKTDPEYVLTKLEVQEYVRSRLSRFCIPRDIVFLNELPRNATGKVVARLLPQLATTINTD